MRAILVLTAAVAVAVAFPASPAHAQCPPGYRQTGHWTTGEGDNVTDHWSCVWAGARQAKNALQQLQNMGKGYVDTSTGFDGGLGPSAAVATAPPPIGSPNMTAVTVEDLQKFAKDPAYSEAVSTHHYASEERKAAEASAAALRQQQAKTTDSLKRQEIQIKIAEAERAVTAAKGAERIAENAVIKEVIRLKPQVMTTASAKKVPAKKAKN